MASAGNATDFGDLTVNARDAGGAHRVIQEVYFALVIVLQMTNLNTIDYVTIASTGNATDFGDIFTGRYSVSSCSNSNRAVFGGGNDYKSNCGLYN